MGGLGEEPSLKSFPPELLVQKASNSSGGMSLLDNSSLGLAIWRDSIC